MILPMILPALRTQKQNKYPGSKRLPLFASLESGQEAAARDWLAAASMACAAAA
jgi:hypothetical protein